MAAKLVLEMPVTFADVDRREVLSLSRLFKYLQEAAIAQANQFGTGTEAMRTRGETWVLNRIAAAIDRYPRHGETLRIETWSNGIRGFKGYRDFRVYDASGSAIVRASSLWLYVSFASKAIVRVPRDVAESFPTEAAPSAFPQLEKLTFDPLASDAHIVPIRLRYSDIDPNEHVNNSAYLEFVQSALAEIGASASPRQIAITFLKAIPATATDVSVTIGRVGERWPFEIAHAGVRFAEGVTE